MALQVKPWVGVLLGAGVAIMGTAQAWGPSNWFADNGLKTAASSINTTPAIAGSVPAITATPAQPTAVPWQAGQTPNYRAIVQTYGPAVVGVTVAGMRKSTGKDRAEEHASRSGADDDPFTEFSHSLPGVKRKAPNANVPFHGQGSGFIVSSDGLIITNAHVVKEGKEVTVKLNDRREFPAKVLGVDPEMDIAVLRIEAKGLPTVKMGDPKALQVGDYVLAIGSPFGFEQSATQGIVSAKGRSLPGESYVPFIQTDAAVNPGNSGGPLFDAAGAVVGVNSQIYSQTGGYQGLSFAIPIDVALKIKDQIVAKGHVNHGRMGVQIQELNQTLAESFGLTSPHGAVIAQVVPNGAGAQAGLKAGDVVLALNDQPIEHASDLSSRVGLASPGEQISLKVWRDQAEKQMTVKLGGTVEQPTKVAREDNTPNERGPLGLSARPLSPSERRSSGVSQGLIIEKVTNAAARAGLKEGDILLAINGKPLEGSEQVQSILNKKPKSIALLIQRGTNQIFIPLTLG